MIDNYLNKIQELNVPLPEPPEFDISWLKIPDLAKDFELDYTDPKIQKLIQSIFAPAHYSQPGTKKIVAGGALALLVISLAFLVYRRFMSKAAKACKKFKGEERKECIKKYREKAKQLKVQTLMQNRKVCSKTKNPQKCVEKINKKLRGMSK